MASSSTNRTRSERVASLKLEPSLLSRWLRTLLTGKCLLQFSVAVLAAGLMVMILQGWRPPFAYREGQIPERDVIARVAFDIVDTAKTKTLREQVRREVLCIYENEPGLIQQLGRDVRNHFSILEGEEEFEQLSDLQSQALQDFLTTASNDESTTAEDTLSGKEALARIRALVEEHGNLDGGKLDVVIKSVLDPIAESGVLTSVTHGSEEGDQRSILVDGAFVDVSRVKRAEVVAALPEEVAAKFEQAFESPDAQIVAKMVGRYLVAKMPSETLTYLAEESEEARRKAEEAVEDELDSYYPSVSRLANSGKPITRESEIPVLRSRA